MRPLRTNCTRRAELELAIVPLTQAVTLILSIDCFGNTAPTHVGKTPASAVPRELRLRINELMVRPIDRTSGGAASQCGPPCQRFGSRGELGSCTYKSPVRRRINELTVRRSHASERSQLKKNGGRFCSGLCVGVVESSRQATHDSLWPVSCNSACPCLVCAEVLFQGQAYCLYFQPI